MRYITKRQRFSGKKGMQAVGRLKTGEMNKTEAKYELTLKARPDVAWFKFEGIKFRLADNTFYTPDFAVMLTDGTLEIHEVKGAKAIFQDDAKVKIKVAAEMFPMRFIAVFPEKGGGWEVVEY